jgi:hypothetical protein
MALERPKGEIILQLNDTQDSFIVELKIAALGATRRDQTDFISKKCMDRSGNHFRIRRSKFPGRERKTIGVGVVRIKA